MCKNLLLHKYNRETSNRNYWMVLLLVTSDTVYSPGQAVCILLLGTSAKE